MSTSIQVFFVTLAAGLAMIGAEVFVPGGILGVLGAVCLITAVISGFVAFPDAGIYIAAAVAMLAGFAIYAWLRFFPRSRIGRKMTVEHSMADSRITDINLQRLVGKQGHAASDLRPSGYALIENKRLDAITEGPMIENGAPVRVLRTQFNSLVVERVENNPT